MNMGDRRDSVYLPKIGDFSNCKKWRKIILPDAINRILATILHVRLSAVIEPILTVAIIHTLHWRALYGGY